MVRMIGRAALLVGLLFLWGSAALAASVDVAETEMAFVDAWGDTGYYVDMKSLDFQNDHEVTARVQIVCADKDRLYLYRIHFDRKKRTYQILDSVMGIEVRLGDYQRAVEEHARYVRLRKDLTEAQDYAYSECLIAVYGLEQKQRLMEKLRTENRRLEEDTQKDPLTRLYNRQYLEKVLTRYDSPEPRPAQEMAAIMMDVDFFKGYNDHYGHIQGDTILSEAGRLIWEQRLGGWTPVRYGGEEFLLLRLASAKEALEVAETVRRALEAQRIPHHFSKAAAVVTLSAGVSAKVCCDRRDMEKLINEADQALYAAKARGRNQCVRYRPNLEVKA